MKPSKMRSRQIWHASHSMRSRQLGAALSPDLRSRHSRRSVRVVTGDTVRVVRGEYKDVEGKVSRVFPLGGRLAIEGVKKEKGKGEKFDVEIHSTNVVVTSLNGDDPLRMARIRGQRGVRSPAPAHGKAAGPAVGAPKADLPEPGASRVGAPKADAPKADGKAAGDPAPARKAETKRDAPGGGEAGA